MLKEGQAAAATECRPFGGFIFASEPMAKKKLEKPESAAAPHAEKRVRLLFKLPENQRFAFANNLVVQFDGECFYVTFLETAPPIIMGPESERKLQIETLETVPAYSVAKVVVPTAKMAEFIKVLTKNYTDNVGPINEDDGSSNE